jgi:hypothetical protein
VLPSQVECAVLERRRQDLVARLQVETPCGEVDSSRCVLDEDEIFRIGVDVRPQRRACVGEKTVDTTREEVDRPALELHLPLLVAIEHVPWTRTEGTVVEEHDLLVEQELVAEICHG